jgi:deoxyribonuclease-4
MLIGSHISLSSPDYLLNSLKETRKNGANCMMIYLGSPQNAKLIDDEKLKIEEYKVFASEINYNINNTIIHAPYIINLANKNNNEFSINFLNDEIKKMINIGSKILVLHPGNATNGISISEAIDNLSHIINSLIVPNDIKLCIETMSGKGTEIGKNFSEIKNIIEKIKNKDIIGVCLDTCHI